MERDVLPLDWWVLKMAYVETEARLAVLEREVAELKIQNGSELNGTKSKTGQN